jgi:hypothetical protein
MLRHDVWALTRVERRGGFLCLECIEDRIGRPLFADDFMITPPEMQRGDLRAIERDKPTPPDTRQRELAEWRDYVQRTGQVPAMTDEEKAPRNALRGKTRPSAATERTRLVNRKSGDGKPTLRVVKSDYEPIDPLFIRRPTRPAKVAKLPSSRRSEEAAEFPPEPFRQIPDTVWFRLAEHKPGDAAWACVMELERMVSRHGENPTRLSSGRLRGYGVADRTRERALKKLVKIGLIEIAPTKKGMAPLVTSLWRPRQPT